MSSSTLSNIFVLFVLGVFVLICDATADYELRGKTEFGTSNNLRPCGVLNQVNVMGTQEYFVSRCELYAGPENCTDAWQIFYNIWNGTSPLYNPNNPPNYQPFITFFDWTGYMKQWKLQPIFYSGSGQCPDIVHRLTNVTDIFLITLEDQNGPYSVANAAWCGAEYFNSSLGSCANVTTWGQVPNGNDQFNGYQGAAFWGPASVHFGKSAFDMTWALIRSYETPRGPIKAFPSGIFRQEELPTIMANPQVTGFRVIVVSNANQPAETCDHPNGSVIEIQQMIGSTWNDTGCIVDPPCILQFVCNSNDTVAFNSTDLIDKEKKCKYYNALKEAIGHEANLNCYCSTDTLTLDGNTFKSTSASCPSAKIKGPSHWYDWPNWLIILLVGIGAIAIAAAVAGVLIRRRRAHGYEAINTRP